jgi:hypothetical protein
MSDGGNEQLPLAQNPNRESSPENPNREPSPENEPEAAVEKARSECLRYVERYRNDDISKTLATAHISKTVIGLGPAITESAARAALEAYYGMLDDHASSQEAANKRGRERTRDDLSKRKEKENARGEDRSMSRSPSRSLSRSRSGSPEPKRRKTIDVSAQPWLVKSVIEEACLSPELKKTLDYLRAWSVDPKTVKNSITQSASCPEFPQSEWVNIIAGKAVSLDHILSATYTTIADNRNVTKFGNIEITSENSAPPLKLVKTHGEWSAAWQKAQIAYTYVMPHRATELQRYGDHISQLFSAFSPANHGRIINYDKALRTLVASRRNVTLGDYHEFQALRIAHLDHHGSGSGQTSGSGSKNSEAKSKASATKRRAEVCRRHNSGTCPGSCGRLHACSICKDVSHVEADCPKAGNKN